METKLKDPSFFELGNLKGWRTRNGVEVPQEYINGIKQRETILGWGCLVIGFALRELIGWI